MTAGAAARARTCKLLQAALLTVERGTAVSGQGADMSASFRDPFDASAPLGNGCSCGRHASEHEHDRAQQLDRKGDRVKNTMSGRFLPYKQY